MEGEARPSSPALGPWRGGVPAGPSGVVFPPFALSDASPRPSARRSLPLDARRGRATPHGPGVRVRTGLGPGRESRDRRATAWGFARRSMTPPVRVPASRPVAHTRTTVVRSSGFALSSAPKRSESESSPPSSPPATRRRYVAASREPLQESASSPSRRAVPNHDYN